MRTVVIGPEANSDEDDVTVFAVGDVVYLKIDRREKVPVVTLRVKDGLLCSNERITLHTTDFYDALEDFVHAARVREAELGWDQKRPTIWERL